MSVKKSFEQYLKINAINWSTLKEVERSLLRYKYRLTNPREDSTGLARGRAVHTAVLEPEKFSKEYVVFEGKTRRGTAWDEFEALHEDKTILKVDEYDKAWKAAAAVKRHPEVVAFMQSGTPEKEFTWKDKDTELKCKCRVDWVGEVLFDLKTTGNIDARIFGNLSARMLYHGQLAMYRDGAKHKGDVFIVAVEAEAPFDVVPFQLHEDELFAGQELYLGYLKQVAECRNTDLWPGRYPGREALVLPKYVYEDDQEDGSFELIAQEG